MTGRERGGVAQRQSSAQAVYVFGFVSAKAAHVETADFEQRGDEIVLLKAGDIAALTCCVVFSDFAGEQGERNLADPRWLLPRIRHHEETVEAAMRAQAVFPAGFATLFSSAEALARFMLRNQRAVAAFLANVAGRREWAVRLIVELGGGATLEAIAAAERPDWSALSAGFRYLRLRQARPQLIKAAQERAEALMSGWIAQFRELSSDLRLKPPAAEPETYDQPLTLLLSSDREDDLRALAAALEAHAQMPLRVAITGPWPPYSFRPPLETS